MNSSINCVVVKDKDNNVIYVATTKYHNEKEIADLVNMANANQEKSLKEKYELQRKVVDLEKAIKELKQEIKVLKGEE